MQYLQKRVHCGCIASLYSFFLLDAGGVECISCATKSAAGTPLKHIQHGVPLSQRVVDAAVPVRNWPDTFGTRASRNIDVGSTWQPYSSTWFSRQIPEVDKQAEGTSAEPTQKQTGSRKEDSQLESKFEGSKDTGFVDTSRVDNENQQNSRDLGTSGKTVQVDTDGDTMRGVAQPVLRINALPVGSGKVSTDGGRVVASKGLYSGPDVLITGPSTSLSLSTGISAGKDAIGDVNKQGALMGSIGGMTTANAAGSPGVSVELKDLASKLTGASPFRARQRQLLPRPYQTGTGTPSSNAEAKGNDSGSVRIARPPGQGRGRNQLLPRYWPRITDQELQQITSGDSNATITPLFEKMLSASDAGRIGRLVLPKACAEAYFPTISHPEGQPMKIQDINGKDWTFQFRFWPNNNSRMYVLEGVTPCIQSMQLQAGDTVTFSRLDPEGKLVMGFRRAPASLTSQVDRKQRGRPITGKSKRLRLENEDSLELKENREEAQDLLRPPPSVVPSILTIEGHDFEEYEEPPVFTKRTIFTSRQTGEQDQWAQCDECGNWRRVPPDALVSARWTCSDNCWDPKRASCGAPQELSSDDVDHLLGLVPGEGWVPVKSESKIVPSVGGPSASLEALATAAVMGDTGRNSTSPSSPARTTKHPRHRPGCTCIVCIQPPSGKGPKHKQNCNCNVCVTVKRRFKTLMMRRKKRLSEREAEGYVRRRRKDELEVSSSSKILNDAGSLADGGSRREGSGGTVVEGPRKGDGSNAANNHNISSVKQSFGLPFAGLNGAEDVTMSKGQFDLNIQPEREEEPSKVASRISMKQLLQDASLPLDAYLKQQGMTCLFGGQELKRQVARSIVEELMKIRTAMRAAVSIKIIRMRRLQRLPQRFK